ncbi:hypothetical protein [Arthrobacter sp. JSM 101049]|uniref:hypothetical protein n=1 Tax=Arthrobacter sp. JSM 101049 TaxID=929097 RepID=UPI0035658526
MSTTNEPTPSGNGPADDQAATPDPSYLGTDEATGGHEEEHHTFAGSADGELVDVGEDGETIRTLDERQTPDGSGNDADDPDQRPDDDGQRYDAG